MEEIDKMSLLISDILRDYKQEENYVSTRLRRVNISDLMTDLIPKYEGWLMRNRIRFSVDVQEGIFAMADPDQLEQAVHNYMMNAVSHTRPDRRITLTLASDGGFARIAVYNEGNGIPPADLENIWKSHYQTAGTRGPSETGLGLYIVKLIVSRHAGRCGAGNADNGVTFWIELPVLDGTETEVITHGRAGGEW